MRNLLAHRYGEVNDTLVFQALKYELLTDALEFVGLVRDLDRVTP